MPYYHRVIHWIRVRKTSVGFFGILIIAFAFFSALKHEPIFMDGDPFYHAKITQLMLEHKDIVRDLPWLPISVFRDGYVDHHFLFHVFLLPFNMLIGDPLVAIRVATSFFSALFLAVVYLFFKKLLPYAAFFPFFLILFSSSLLFRLSLDKAPAISLIVLFFGLYALITRKKITLFCISFVYVWLYDAWPLLLVASMLFCIADACATLFTREQEFSLRTFPLKKMFSLCVRKENRTIFLSCTTGILAGIIINPYFPQNVFFYNTHLLSIALVTSGIFYGIGNEWLPKDPVSLASDNIPLVLFWICTLCWVSLQISARMRPHFLQEHMKTPSSLSVQSLFFLFFSLVLFFATIKSQRMAEYFIPIASACVACVLQDMFKRGPWRELLASIRDFLKNSSLRIQHVFCCIAGLVVCAIVLRWTISLSSNLWNAVNGDNFSFYSMGRAGAFISKNIPKDSLIINDNWSHFPQLMYYADAHRFAWGLDPTFTHDADLDFFSTVSSLAQEKNKNKLASILKDTLHAQYLLIAKESPVQEKKLALLAKKDTGLKKIYEDDEVLIYQTRETAL
ncbi:hypothetical protein HYW94_03930 [Candidatus Uhrbacteria bacterium]|nr:hypothetical protein [Candidatus Uhrbacteria bacterium]